MSIHTNLLELLGFIKSEGLHDAFFSLIEDTPEEQLVDAFNIGFAQEHKTELKNPVVFLQHIESFVEKAKSRIQSHDWSKMNVQQKVQSAFWRIKIYNGLMLLKNGLDQTDPAMSLCYCELISQLLINGQHSIYSFFQLLMEGELLIENKSYHFFVSKMQEQLDAISRLEVEIKENGFIENFNKIQFRLRTSLLQRRIYHALFLHQTSETGRAAELLNEAIRQYHFMQENFESLLAKDEVDSVIALNEMKFYKEFIKSAQTRLSGATAELATAKFCYGLIKNVDLDKKPTHLKKMVLNSEIEDLARLSLLPPSMGLKDEIMRRLAEYWEIIYHNKIWSRYDWVIERVQSTQKWFQTFPAVICARLSEEKLFQIRIKFLQLMEEKKLGISPIKSEMPSSPVTVSLQPSKEALEVLSKSEDETKAQEKKQQAKRAKNKKKKQREKGKRQEVKEAKKQKTEKELEAKKPETVEVKQEKPFVAQSPRKPLRPFKKSKGKLSRKVHSSASVQFNPDTTTYDVSEFLIQDQPREDRVDDEAEMHSKFEALTIAEEKEDYYLPIPTRIRNIMQIIEDDGYHIVIEGGFIRDGFFEKPISDIDLVTDCPRSRIIELIPEAVGSFPLDNLVTLKSKDSVLDVDFTVLPVFDLDDFVKNKFLVVNALFANKDGTIIDPKGVFQKIYHEKLLPLMNIVDDFKEDASRILRTIRCCNHLDIPLDAEISSAIYNPECRAAFKNIPFGVLKKQLLEMFNRKQAAKNFEKLNRFALLPLIDRSQEKGIYSSDELSYQFVFQKMLLIDTEQKIDFFQLISYILFLQIAIRIKTDPTLEVGKMIAEAIQIFYAPYHERKDLSAEDFSSHCNHTQTQLINLWGEYQHVKLTQMSFAARAKSVKERIEQGTYGPLYRFGSASPPVQSTEPKPMALPLKRDLGFI